ATQLRQPKPKRHHAFEHAAFARTVAAARALAGDDQHHAVAARLPRAEVTQQRRMRLGLRHAMQIEPSIDRLAAARDALPELALQWSERRRNGFGGRNDDGN